MPSTIIVNSLTTQHKASMGMASGFPDVCKTPAPPAPSPVPIPYPNIGMSNMASSKVSKKVKNNGQKVMVKGSAYTMTSGDEAGVMFGIISNRIKGKSEILNCSFDVKYEGKGVGRLSDPHGNNCGSKTNCPVMAEMQGPNFPVPMAERDAACKALKKCHVTGKDRDKALKDCGMNKKHADAIAKSCSTKPKTSVTFRSTNTKCSEYIDSGFITKGSDVKNKTISSKRDPYFTEAQSKKVSDNNLDGLVGEYETDGALKGIKTDNGVIPLDDIPPVPSADGSAHSDYGRPYTGDYDAHDMFGEGGRMKGASPEEAGCIEDINNAIGREKGGDMVQHGPQSNYSEFCAAQKPPLDPKIEGTCGLQLPDVSSPDDHLLAFDESGDTFVLKNEDDLKNYYACKGQEFPPEWKGDKRKEIEECAARQKAQQIAPLTLKKKK